MKEHVDVIKDSFVDYAGKTHHFVIAAYTREVADYSIAKVSDFFGLSLGKVVKAVSLGISICNPEDEFVEKVGVLKAIARAKNSAPVLYVTDYGYVNKTLIEAFLKQEAEYLKANPATYIKGYDDSKERYLKKQEMSNIEKNFTEVERIVVEGVKKDPKFLDNVNTYLEWLDKQKKSKCKKSGK